MGEFSQMSMIIAWLSASLGLFIASRVLSGVKLASATDALWAGALLGVLQWALYKFIFLALGVATLGIGFLLWFITRWIASALVILLTSKLSSRLHVDGFFSALITAFIVAAAGSAVRWAM
ncbi:MAG: phage holin family protein [Myxococcales bacterium]